MVINCLFDLVISNCMSIVMETNIVLDRRFQPPQILLLESQRGLVSQLTVVVGKVLTLLFMEGLMFLA